MRVPWTRKPAYVEWTLSRDGDAFGAVIYRSSAPMITVGEIPAVHPSTADAGAAVERWVAASLDRYRLNDEFEAFKATVRRLEAQGDPGMDESRLWGRPE